MPFLIATIALVVAGNATIWGSLQYIPEVGSFLRVWIITTLNLVAAFAAPGAVICARASLQWQRRNSLPFFDMNLSLAFKRARVCLTFYPLKSNELVSFELYEEGPDYSFSVFASRVDAVCSTYLH